MKLKKQIEIIITVGGPNNEYCGDEWFGSGCSGYNGEYNKCNYFHKNLQYDYDKNGDGLLRCDECKKGDK